MLTVETLASSSRGNAHILRDQGRALLLDCGLTLSRIAGRVGARELDGVLLTHEHQDHARAARLLMMTGIDVYASEGTFTAMGLDGDPAGHRARRVEARRQFAAGPWTVLPFDAVHDAAEPLGFLIQAPGGAKALYLTDSAYCKHRFRGLTHILIECNYSEEALWAAAKEKAIAPAHYRRVARNHMSLERLLRTLAANDLSAVEEIHLLHLSDQHSDEAGFKRQVQRLTGKPTYIAPA